MSKPIKKIFFILFLIVLLPVLFFSFREIATLNENEKVIENIYKNQLEAILFSVNQYSEDIVRSWSVKIESFLTEKNFTENVLKQNLEDFYKENKSVNAILLADSSLNVKKSFSAGAGSNSAQEKLENIELILSDNKTEIRKLFSYLDAGFIKIEPLKGKNKNGINLLVFVLKNRNICGIVFEPELFVRQILVPKIQSVERNEFFITVFDSVNNKEIYAKNNVKTDFQKSSLWLFPNFRLGIGLRGETVEQIVRQKTNTNFVLIVAMGFLMIAAAWIGYINIKREVELAQIKADFVANVSHELRTPLSLINMFAETLSLGRVKSEEKRNEYYSIILHEIERLSKIVNKILSFSKIEAGKWKYNFVKADLKQVLEKIFNNYKFHLSNEGFDFNIEIKDRELDAVIDPESISEAVINLLDNAVKYSGDIKSICLRAGKSGDNVFIEVEDRGIGVADKDKEKIFEKFFRVTSGNIHNTKGTGLGLTLVSHIVEAHNGKIYLKSELGKGSCFRITFPAGNNNLRG